VIKAKDGRLIERIDDRETLKNNKKTHKGGETDSTGEPAAAREEEITEHTEGERKK